MTDPPGRLIGTGRAADVYDLGDGTVLRRYRSSQSSEPEARAMAWLGEHSDLNLPAVHSASGRDLVMDLVPGPTMMEDVEARPWRILGHARTLARLQRRLNGIDAPEWFPERPGVPAGCQVLHLDLHPMNVILGPAGPTIIDWTNVVRGHRSFDAAMSFVLMSGFEVSGAKDRAGRRLMVEIFAASRGRSAIRSVLSEAIDYRLADPNTTPGERSALLRIGASHR
ncbi:MAG: phosphotransferase [Microthrixaceae bacterium]